MVNEVLQSLMHPIELDAKMRTALVTGAVPLEGGRQLVVARSEAALHEALLDRVEWCVRATRQETA